MAASLDMTVKGQSEKISCDAVTSCHRIYAPLLDLTVQQSPNDHVPRGPQTVTTSLWHFRNNSNDGNKLLCT